MPLVKGPVLDFPEKECPYCGHNSSPYFGNIAPRYLMNYLLESHATYLFHAVIKNVDYLNNIRDTDNMFLMVKKRDTAKEER